MNDLGVCIVIAFALGLGGGMTASYYIADSYIKSEIVEYVKEHKQCPFEIKESIEVVDLRKKKGD